ncbi:DUF7660 family protein [Rhodococcus triatomae]|uniref:DUF7660 family protein n=1 Tax=Rhodococcus triatomae TaxID=300028 RepID=UPI003CCDE250
MAEIRLDLVNSRESFVELVRNISADVARDSGAFENVSTADYLEALAAWVEDMDGRSHRFNEPAPGPDWRFFAMSLVAALDYE